MLTEEGLWPSALTSLCFAWTLFLVSDRWDQEGAIFLTPFRSQEVMGPLVLSILLQDPQLLGKHFLGFWAAWA